ncbi:MAG: quinoprotein relay system zinc metallohydrolase 2 [Rhodobacteraceae bacterium]|nr:MAG: quinoprotein relay system zinc metallohydrolase 2 [Paracoccaceae bacterium]
MWEILLTACLTAAPTTCETHRRAGGADYAACRARAETQALPAGWRPESWPCVRAGETPEMAVTEVAAGVFVRRGVHELSTTGNAGAIANAGFVIGDEAVAVIDSGGSYEDGRNLLAAIRARTDLPVRWLILTHMHPDHVLGAAAFVDAGATVVGHANLPRALATRGGSYIEGAVRAFGDIGATRIVAVDETVDTTREIDLGGRLLLLEAHPVAHTDNDLTVRDLATDTWFLGDIVFMSHLPTMDGSVNGWIALLDDLTVREAARVVPGHGPVSYAWPDAAAPIRAYLAHLREAAREAVREGRPMLEATRAIARRTPPGWALTEAFAERNATVAIREMEWE